MSAKYDYYHSRNSEQFSFFRIPKALFSDASFCNLSTDAKLLYLLSVCATCGAYRPEYITTMLLYRRMKPVSGRNPANYQYCQKMNISHETYLLTSMESEP